ncbi:MAG: FapA family protein [Chloroflexi bacterium]|nr:FapA family protein [Chloroflexota bacterium]
MARRLHLTRAAGIIAALLLIGAAASVALAQDTALDGKLRVGETVLVPADETIDGDLYLAAGTVTMDGTVDGDLTATGGQVAVNGTVTGDVLAAGGMISIVGSVEGDLRTAGGQISISGDVIEDTLAAGGQITIASTGTIDGDLIVTGGDVRMAGAVNGSIEASGGAYERTGTVGGTENVFIGEADDDDEPSATEPLDNAVGHFVTLLVLGGLAIWLIPRAINGAESALRTRPFLSLGGGLAAIVGYIAFVIVAVLVIVILGIVFGVLSLESIAAVTVLTGIVVIGVVSFLFGMAVAFGGDIVVALLVARLAGRGGMGTRWRELILFGIGAAVVVIATSLPVIGGIVKLGVVLFGLGALAVVAYRAWRGRSRPTVPQGPPAAEAGAV